MGIGEAEDARRAIRYMDIVNSAQHDLEAIVADVQGIEDPAERLVVARDVFALLRDTTALLGPQGLRGAAAVDAVKRYGSAQAAADAAGVPRSVVTRLVEKVHQAEKKKEGK